MSSETIGANTGHPDQDDSKLRLLQYQLDQCSKELDRVQGDLIQLRHRYSRMRYRAVDRIANVIERTPLLDQLLQCMVVRPCILYQRWTRGAATVAPQTPVSLPISAAAGCLSAAQAHQIIAGFHSKPLVSIVVPVYRVDPQWLDKCIQSVHQQYYENWELILVDDCSQQEPLTQLMLDWSSRDSRIIAESLTQNSGISLSSNRGIELARGTFIGFLDHDDELTPDALTWVVARHNRSPEAAWFYSDEDKVDAAGQYSDPFFKPDYSPEYLLSNMYTCHFSVYSAELLRRSGGLRKGFEGSQDHDLALRLSEIVRRDQVVHIPRILYHWRTLPQSTASGSEAKPYAAIAGRKAVTEALARRGIRGEPRSAPTCPSLYQIHLEPISQPKTSILIPTRNLRPELIRCIDSLRSHTRYSNLEIVVIDNQSDDPQLLDYLATQERAGNLRVYRYDKPFNHSEMNNLAAATCDCEYLVFMNNDVELLSVNWLETLAATVQIDATIAGCGALLLYPDRTTQHGGIVLGMDGVVGHMHHGWHEREHGYFGRAHVIHEVSACSAALLLLRKAAFDEVGGFNAARYPTSFNDVDLWLRLQSRGHRCLFNPLVRAIHFESKTREIRVTEEMAAQRRLLEEWGPALQNDPFYNPNLALNAAQFRASRPYPVELDFPELAAKAA